MNEITQLNFTLQNLIWVVDYQYVGGSVLKIGQIIEHNANHYKILSEPEFSFGRYTYKVKQVKLQEYTYN